MNPQELTKCITKEYPKLKRDLAPVLSKIETINPKWCYCPIPIGIRVMLEYRQPMRVGKLDPIDFVTAISWNATKSIYRYDQAILDMLWDTPIEEMPVEILYRLPEWCPYIETPNKEFRGEPLRGFYAYLSYNTDDEDEDPELLVVLDFEDGGRCHIAIHLTASGSIYDGVKKAHEILVKHMNNNYSYNPPLEMANQYYGALKNSDKLAEDVAPLVSTLLYLCAEEPDVYNPAPIQRASRIKRNYNGKATLPTVGKASVREVGFNLSRSLRYESGDHHKLGGKKVPHLRRAHWRTYWTGPRDGTRVPILKWITAHFVGGNSDITTIKRVA